MSNDTNIGQERGVEAIKFCHRAIRAGLQEASDGTATEATTARMELALEVLAILRPEMSAEQVLTAASKRITV